MYVFWKTTIIDVIIKKVNNVVDPCIVLFTQKTILLNVKGSLKTAIHAFFCEVINSKNVII